MDLSHSPERLQMNFNLSCDSLKDTYNCIITTKASHAWFWKTLDKIFWLLRGGKPSDFMDRATTIGPIIAFPEVTDLTRVTIYEYFTLKHEAIHVKQCAALGLGDPAIGVLLFLFLYLFVPLPAKYSWFRFKFEREAFVTEYRLARKLGWTPDIEDYVRALSGPAYLWAWPEEKVRAWFKKNI
jgi:hypothetical protein